MAYVGRFGWNSLDLATSAEDEELLEAVDDPHAAVVSKLPEKHRRPG